MPDKQHHLYLIGLSLVLALGHWVLFAEVEAPRKDALRYADYIYNLAAHDTFGLSYGAVNTAPEPGAANLPLYPWLTSQFAGQQTQQNLACVLTSAPRYDCYSPGDSCGIVSSSAASCNNDFGSLVAFNYGLVALTLYLTGLLSFQIKNSGFVLLVTPVFAFLAFDLTEYAQRFFFRSFNNYRAQIRFTHCAINYSMRTLVNFFRYIIIPKCVALSNFETTIIIHKNLKNYTTGSILAYEFKYGWA